MAAAKKGDKKAVAAAAAPARKTVNRTRRNAMERKCLPKSLKVLYAGSNRAMFRSVLAAWQESRKKVFNSTMA